MLGAMFAAAVQAFADLFTPPFRRTLLKTLGLTITLLVLAFVALETLLGDVLTLSYAWLEALIQIVAGFGVFIGMIFLVPPITSLVASFFLDEIAATVERTRYPADPPGRALPVVPSLLLSLRFFALVALVNVIALVFLLVPGFNLFAFFVANGYLLGREYFELAAFRHLPVEEARALRRRNALTVFLGGLMIAAFLAVPILNLSAPLFATAFRVRVFKGLAPRLEGAAGYRAGPA
jgi:CysZ protein